MQLQQLRDDLFLFRARDDAVDKPVREHAFRLLEALWQRPVMKDPQNLLSSRRQRLDQACEKLTRVVSDQLMQRRHRLELSLKKLDMLNPAHVLQRGYAAVEKNGVLLTSAQQTAAGDRLMLTFQDGTRVVEVVDENEAEKKVRRRR